MLEPLAHTLLIVEDDEQLRHCLTQAMAARGFRVIAAGSVADGLTQVELNGPAFAVVDLRLPDGCGLAVVEALKRRRSDARSRRAMATSQQQSARRRSALSIISRRPQPQTKSHRFC